MKKKNSAAAEMEMTFEEINWDLGLDWDLHLDWDTGWKPEDPWKEMEEKDVTKIHD